MSAPPALGRLIRMRELKKTELPAFPNEQAQEPPSPPLQQFIADALDEAEDFMANYLPSNFKVKSASKPSPPSAAPVEVLSHDVSASDLSKEARSAGAGSETWFARTSVHQNAAKEGTASWGEFDAGLRADHSQHEMEYTPDVKAAHKLVDWEAELAGMDGKVGAWEDVGMSVVEMVHKIPPPLKDRVFPVAVITAKKAEEFLVVQIPVETEQIDTAKYSADGKHQVGMYCSIERGELVDGGGRVKWQMATASDAKGILPMSVQKMAVPGAVVKDVGLFIGWTAKRRQGKA